MEFCQKVLLKIPLLKYNSHTMQFIHLKVQFNGYSQSVKPPLQSVFEHFHHFGKKNLTPMSNKSSFPSNLPNLGNF